MRLDIFQTNQNFLVVIKNFFKGNGQELAAVQCYAVHDYIISLFCSEVQHVKLGVEKDLFINDPELVRGHLLSHYHAHALLVLNPGRSAFHCSFKCLIEYVAHDYILCEFCTA
mgnify:CR=1 FL=1